MTRTLKALGLAILAVCAFAVAASSASAAVDKLRCGTPEISSCDITGTGATTFRTKAGGPSITCATQEYSASITSVAEEVAITPHYTGCTVLGSATTIDTTGCTFLITGTTTATNDTSGVARGNTLAAHLRCTAGNAIKTTAACPITFTGAAGGLNQNLHGIKLDTEGSGSTDDLKLTIEVDNIHYETPGGFFCNIAGLGTTGNDAFLTGTATVKGYATGNHSTHVALYDESV